jgi:glycosyltransferase involved in cell wall biosynthesis
LPSFAEGLPRALVEAMARALPCVGSAVGGVAELLPDKDFVRPGDPEELARKIIEVVQDPERMRRMSDRNLGIARRYVSEELSAKHQVFCCAVRDRTAGWLKQQGCV